jgi:NagD protein
VIPGTVCFLTLLEKQNKANMFFTNNSSKSASDYLKKLRRLRIPATKEQIITSGQATIEYLKRKTSYTRLYLLGTPSLRKEFREAGFRLVADNPDCVVLGFDMTLTYEKLRRACFFIRNGAPYIATHPDLVCPDEKGPIPDAGSMQKMIRAATGRAPDKVIGKPSRLMITMALARAGVRRNHVAMVGDRLYTDMRMARRAGVLSILVLTGESGKADLKRAKPRPDLVFDSIAELANAIKD